MKGITFLSMLLYYDYYSKNLNYYKSGMQNNDKEEENKRVFVAILHQMFGIFNWKNYFYKMQFFFFYSDKHCIVTSFG